MTPTAIAMTAIPSAAPPGAPVGAGAVPAPGVPGPGPVAPVVAHLALANNTALYIPLSDGRFIKIPFKDAAQAARHSALHQQILGTGAYPPGTVINLSEGRLECDGMPVPCATDIKNDIFEMQKLVDEAMDRTWSETSWPIYIGQDRAPINAPPAFQQFAQGRRLDQIKFTREDAQRARHGKSPQELQIMNAHKACRKKLHQGTETIIANLEARLAGVNTLESQGRIQQIKRTKEHFEKHRRVIGQFATYYPLDLTGLPPAQIQHELDAQKVKARAYLDAASARLDGKLKRSEKPEVLDQLATELALICCQTPYEYQLGCIHFGVERTQTSPELFFIRLASMIRADKPQREIDTFIDQHMKIGFPHLNHPEDRALMKAGLLQIAQEITNPAPPAARLPGIGL